MNKILLILAVAILGCLPMSALEDNERVQFGNDIHVTADEHVSDVVCFFCNARVEGSAGDVVVFFGQAYIDGKAEDAVVFGNNLRLGENATVHDPVVMGGSIQRAPGAVVRGDVVVLPPIVLLFPLIGLVFLVWLAVVILRNLFGGRRVVYVQQRPQI